MLRVKRTCVRIVSVFTALVMITGIIFLPVCAAGERTTVAEWKYASAEDAPKNAEELSEGIGATTGSGRLSLCGGPMYTSYSSKSLASNPWTDGGFWQIAVNAENYENLAFSADTRSSGTGPKNFCLEYSINEGKNWIEIPNSQIENTTTLSKKWKEFSLPNELDGKEFLLRVIMVGTENVNGATVASGGVSNINNIVITGEGASTGEVEEACKMVVASQASGVVETGTKISLSCETAGAEIWYKVNDASTYEKYENAIEITEDTIIEAYASKSGMKDSNPATFSYTVEKGELPANPGSGIGEKLTTLSDGDVFVIYNPANKKVMSSTISGTRLEALNAEVSDERLNAPGGSAVLIAKYDETSGYYTFTSGGKYLATGETGGKLIFEENAGDYSLWELEKADEEGGYFLRSVNAEYGGNKNQYIEYYSTFTTYGKKATDKPDAFLMNFYRAKEGVEVDTSVTFNAAMWAGNANYTEAGTKISGDLYETNDMKDTSVSYVAVKDGQEVQPYTLGGSAEARVYYLGGTNIGSGTDDYVQFALSSLGFGNMDISLRLRATNAGAGSWQFQYSADSGKTFENFTTGDYAYKYTSYGSDGKPFEVSKDGKITDGIAKTSYAAGQYINFHFDIPEGAENVENLLIRLVPGTKRADGKEGNISGNLRVDSVRITGNPVIASDICEYVKADPASGEASANSEITLSTATQGAEIYYSLNEGEVQKYDEVSKPKLETLPATLLVYAKKDGMKDSIKTVYKYNAGKVKAVKASPNGGAVQKDTNVTLKCDTEGAVIWYSEDDGISWKEYKEALVLSELPKTYQVKATKEGYEDSSVVTLSYTERSSEKYTPYFGQLHSHTNYSDGSGSCEDAFKHASQVENLDFLAVTDHSNSFDNADSANILDGSMSTEWTEGHQLADKYTDEDFVGLFGYEMTWSNGLGHMNTFNTDGFQSRTQKDYTTYSTALQNYYTALKKDPDAIAQFNHPGTTFGDFSDFSYYDEEIDDLITTIEVGNGEGAVGSTGYFPSYEYYQRALDKGWHVAPTNNQDNHKGLWGDANTTRSVVLADSLTRENVYDAMRNYRVYATEDNDLNIYYTLDGYEMGSILSEGQTGEKVNVKAELSDKTDASIGKVQVITNGGIVLEEKNVSGNEETVEFAIDNQYSFYYLKVVQNDGDIAVTAPVWVGDVEAAGINSISTKEVLPVRGEELQIDLELYNNENSDMQIDSVTFTADGKEIHEVDLKDADLEKVKSMSTAKYSFGYTHDRVGQTEIKVTVSATLNGSQKVYSSVLKLTYVTPQMVTNVIIDGTHYNDYVTGYYGGNMGNFAAIAGEKNVKVKVVTDKITPEMLDSCALLVISAPAKKSGTANAGDFEVSHFEDDFIAMVKDYTDKGGALIACGIADYQDTKDGQTTTEMNKLLKAIGATTKLNSDEAYDTENNGGQPYRLYLKGTYKEDSKYLAGADKEQEWSAYSGCTVNVDADAEKAGKAEALIRGYDTTYSINTKNDDGTYADSAEYVKKGDAVVFAHETLNSGANVFVAGTVFISDFEVKAELDNVWDLPYLNRTVAENILKEVMAELDVTPIAEVRKADKGEVFTIEGYMTAGTEKPETSFFDAICVQDDTAGITVFPFAEAGYKIGTKIKATGYVDEYQGEKELQILSYTIVDGDTHVHDPEKMSAKDAMDYEKSGGKLVQIEGKVVKVLHDSQGSGVSQFWIDDGSGVEGNVFIDGYIMSGITGKNELASTVKEGAVVSAVGLVYAHPEGESDVPITCLRVRNCDEIKLLEEGSSGNDGDDNDGDDDGDNGNNEEGNGSGNGGSGSSNNGKHNNDDNSGKTNGTTVKTAKTGDMATPILYVILLAATSIMIVTVVIIKKKRDSK